MSDSLIPSFFVIAVNESLRSLIKNERCEQIAQVAHQKWARMSDSLRLLTKNERPWANRSGLSPKMCKWANSSFFEQIARFLSESLILSFFRKHELSLRNPVSEFPALAEAEAGAIFFFGSSSVSGSSRKGRLRLYSMYNIIKIITKIIPFWRITKWNTSLICKTPNLK